MRREKEGKMGCFEILYKDCFDKKCVGFGYGESKEEVIEKFPTFNGCRLIDIKETDYDLCRRNKLQHFTQYTLSM